MENQEIDIKKALSININNGKKNADIGNLTKGQQAAYKGLMEFINAPFNPNDFKRALVGYAGVGKTYLVKTLLKNCNISYSQIGLSAPSHKACRVLRNSIAGISSKVNTIQSDFGLRLNFNIENFDINNPPFDPRGRIKVENYVLYIVDEASMINAGLFNFMCKILKKNKCKLIVMGDDHQLPPVNETKCQAFVGIKTFYLTEIVRQEEDNPIRYLLDLLRYDIDHRTTHFINYISTNKEAFDSSFTKGFKVLDGAEFNNEVAKQFSDEQITKNTDYVRVIAYTNNCVSYWNKTIRNAIIKDSDKSVITKNDLITSYTTIVDDFNDPIIRNSEDYIIKDIVNYVHPNYQLNGFMVKFQAIFGGYVTSPLFVINHKDLFTVQMYCRLSAQLIEDAKNARKDMRAARWKEYYEFKESCLLLTNIGNNVGTILYQRDLDYGFAITSHKSQGSTYNVAMIDINDMVYDKYGNPYSNIVDVNKRLYVALSRAKDKIYLKYDLH